MPGELTDKDRLILDIAGRHYRFESSREQAARDELGLSGTAYWQQLVALIDREEAIAYAATTCRLLRERIQRGRTARSARHLRP